MSILWNCDQQYNGLIRFKLKHPLGQGRRWWDLWGAVRIGIGSTYNELQLGTTFHNGQWMAELSYEEDTKQMDEWYVWVYYVTYVCEYDE